MIIFHGTASSLITLEFSYLLHNLLLTINNVYTWL